MNYTTVESECATKDMTYNCTNRRDEISIGGLHHGDYDLRCTDRSNTQLVRGNCELSQINADRPSACGSAGFEEFLQTECGDFVGRHDLLLDERGQPEVVFMWSISGDKVSGALSFNGKASWLAMGTEHVGGGKNGMQGGKVVLGISSQDTEFPDHTGTVQEYRIHESESRFRLWNTAYDASTMRETEIIEENCYMAMKFTTDSIFGESLNISSGSNRLIWALRASTYMQIGKDSYHEGCSGENRTRYRGGGAESPWIIDFRNTTRSSQDTGVVASTSLSSSLATSLSSEETAASSSPPGRADFAVALGVAMAAASFGCK